MSEDTSMPQAEESAQQPAPTGIVVGVDGSEHSDCALSWAIAEAQAGEGTLNLITAYSTPVFAASGLDGGFATIDDEEISQGATAVTEAAAQRAAAESVTYTTQVANGDATAVLVEASQTAAMIVVGSRGRGGFLGRLLGSVSSGLPGHSKCPTVVVPKVCAHRFTDDAGTSANAEQVTGAAGQVEPVVCVGVDGSDQARYATLVAAEYAQRHQLKLRILCAVPNYTAPMGWLPSPVDRDAVFADIREQLHAGEEWVKHHFSGLDVETVAVEGNPIERLIEATKRSELVVAGSHGHGGFAGMLLGSTTHGLLHHAQGPVMVVVDQEDPRLSDRADFGPVLKNV